MRHLSGGVARLSLMSPYPSAAGKCFHVAGPKACALFSSTFALSTSSPTGCCGDFSPGSASRGVLAYAPVARFKRALGASAKLYVPSATRFGNATKTALISRKHASAGKIEPTNATQEESSLLMSSEVQPSIGSCLSGGRLTGCPLAPRSGRVGHLRQAHPQDHSANSAPEYRRDSSDSRA
jgi:hypothetical protein